ncbi:MAG: hypothetical protein JEZ02_09355 [Desulfatibacillum sp.]|nr:hypothetical protein [Desulfatibacillum sp.]
MMDTKKDIRFVLWLGNFLCMGLCLAYWAGACFSLFVPVTSQKSILVVLILTPACVYLGKHLWERLGLPGSPGGEFILLAAFIYPASAANLIFSPGQMPGLSLALPIFAIAWTKWFSSDAARVEEYAEDFLTLLCQIAALALVLRISGQWWQCMAASALVCGAAYWLIGQSRPQMLTVILSPLMALWFFLNLSNQLVNSYSGWSRFSLLAGAALYLGFIGIGRLLAVRNSPNLKKFNRACLLIFAASLITDFNPEAGMSTPLHMLDFHWWIHVAPGLDAIFDTMQPYVHYIPFEGFIFETMLPRLWFVGLNQTMGGYFIVMAAFWFASLAIYALLLYALLTRVLGLEQFVAGLLASLLVITNFSLLQIAYPFPGAWTVAERSLVCFVCVLLFFRLQTTKSKGWLGVLTGGAHAFSFFYEPFFGLACLVALAGAMAIKPKKLNHKMALIGGTAGMLALFIVAFRIPLYMFFIHQPLAMVDSGNQIVKLGEGKHIFQALFRDHTFSAFHYWNSLGAMLVFLGLAPTRARHHKFFSMALYFFIATFFMVISGGQRFFGDPGQTFSTVHFAAMASVLAIPLWLCLIRMGLDLLEPGGISRKALVMTCLTAAIFIAYTDGIHRGLAPGPTRAGISKHHFEATAWDEQVHYQATFSNSIPVILEYYHTCKSRKYVASGPKPLGIYYMPYETWKNTILPMQPVQDVRAFISHSRINNNR